MNRLALSLAAISIFTGCAGAANLHAGSAAPAHESAAPREAAAAVALTETVASEALPEAPIAAAGAASRAPGDFVVRRFSGSFRKAPLTLTERVLAREGTVLLIEATLDGDEQRDTLRVRMSDAPETRGQVLAVTRVKDGNTEQAGPDDYDAMMTEVTLAADQNEELLSSDEGTVDVAGTPVACRTSRYRVKVGAREATLRTVESATFAWGDVGGEITGANGKVIYKAEVVELGHGQAAAPAPVASSTYDDE